MLAFKVVKACAASICIAVLLFIYDLMIAISVLFKNIDLGLGCDYFNRSKF